MSVRDMAQIVADRTAAAEAAKALAAEPAGPVTIERLTARAALQPHLRGKIAVMKQAAVLGHKQGDHEWAKGVEWTLALFGQMRQEP
jgi:hypothetical protein